MMDLILGRSDNIIKIGDVVEMLLSISFGVKDSMLDWQWLGINPQEWPPQRLDWEMYRLEHLAFAIKHGRTDDRMDRTSLARAVFCVKVHGVSRLEMSAFLSRLPCTGP